MSSGQSTPGSDIQQLLSRISSLRIKYEPLRAESRFNVFTTLRQANEEVALHSAFIAELLNPNGTHNHGHEFLREFFGVLQRDTAENETSLEQAQLEREYPFRTSAGKTGRIDILIETETSICAIENKIHAKDQPQQLDRYFEFIEERARKPNPHQEVFVLYLTLDGSEPAEGTWTPLHNGDAKSDTRLVCLPYYAEHNDSIHGWISACLRLVSLEPIIRETLRQYQILIERLTGHTMASKEKKEVVEEIMRDESTVRAAQAVSEAWPKAVEHGVTRFWEELRDKIEKNFEDVQFKKHYSFDQDQRVSKLLNNKRGLPGGFGLMFRTHDNARYRGSEGSDVCIYVGVSKNSGDLWLGVTMFDPSRSESEEARSQNDAEEFEALRTAFQNSPHFSSPGGPAEKLKYWLFREQLSDAPRLSGVNDAYPMLLSETRKKTTAMILDQIIRWDEEIMSILDELNATSTP